MNNGRENRNNGNQEKGKEEKETLSKFSTRVKRGRSKASPKFLCGARSEGPRSIRLCSGALYAMRNALLLLGTQATIRAEIAVDAGLRHKLALCDSLRCVLHAGASTQQLGLCTGGDDWHVLLKVVKTQRADG